MVVAIIVLLGTKNTKILVNYSRGAAQTSGWWVPARLRAPHALTEATTLWGMLAGSTIWNQNWKIYFLMNYCSWSQLLFDRSMGLWLASKQESWMHLAATRMRQPDKTSPFRRLAYCIMPYLIFVIFLHEQNFWRIKLTPKKRVIYDKIHRKLPIFCIITAKYTVNCQFFALNL